MKYMKLLAVLLVIPFIACEDYVNNVDAFIDRMVDEALNLESQVPLMMEGVIKAAHEVAAEIFLMSDGLADVLIWDQRLAGATYTAFRELEETLIDDLNSSTNGAFYDVQYARALADRLIERIQNELPEVTDQATVDEGLYHAYLYSGYARYLLGTYYGRDENTGGATVNNSAFMPTSELYDEAIALWNEAMQYTADPNDIKIIHSLIGRCYFLLPDPDYATAATHLDQGLAMNDDPLLGRYDLINVDNYYRTQASTQSRIQWRVDDRFGDYVAAEATEKNRIKFKKYYGMPMLEQTMYVKEGSVVTPIPFIDWQEVAMMKAELMVRGIMGGNPLTLINDVRASKSVATIPAGTAVGLEDGDLNIYVERDKALFLRGLRLIDQRRFDRFHTTYGWKYFSIPQAEKLKNPNWQ